MLLIENPQAELRTFVLTLSHSAGTKRGQGRGSFVSSVTSLVDRTYIEVVQYLKVWSAAPPKPKPAPASSAQEVQPPIDGGEGVSPGLEASDEAGVDIDFLEGTSPPSPLYELGSDLTAEESS
jgi:hypothetical protein